MINNGRQKTVRVSGGITKSISTSLLSSRKCVFLLQVQRKSTPHTFGKLSLQGSENQQKWVVFRSKQAKKSAKV